MATDDQLLELWRAGDKRAGGQLFERHFRTIYSFFRNKAPHSVDDLVQKTFLACVEGRDRYRGDAAFVCYMLATARFILYRAIDEWNRKGARIDYGVSSLQDINPSPSQIVVEKVQQRVLLEALRRIPIDQQMALELYYVQGIRGAALAEILEIPEPTVRSRIHRGLERLRKQVGALGQSAKLLDASTAELETWLASLSDIVKREDPP